MNKGFIIAAALLVLCISSDSEGTDWEYIMQNKRGDNYYVDLDSIQHLSPDRVRILQKVEPGDSSLFFSLVSDLEIDCTQKKIRTLKKTSTGKKGTVTNIPESNNVQYHDAEGIDELLLEFICSLKKSPDNP